MITSKSGGRTPSPALAHCTAHCFCGRKDVCMCVCFCACDARIHFIFVVGKCDRLGNETKCYFNVNNFITVIRVIIGDNAKMEILFTLDWCLLNINQKMHSISFRFAMHCVARWGWCCPSSRLSLENAKSISSSVNHWFEPEMLASRVPFSWEEKCVRHFFIKWTRTDSG